jgi:hypothetical protein
LTPSGFMQAWTERPRTRRRKVSAPDCTTQTRSDVGSRMIAASARYPSTIVVNVPSPPLSSPLTLCTSTSPSSVMPARCSAAMAKIAADRPAFMSQEPRP